MTTKMKLHQSISFTESQKTQEAHGCKPWASNLSIIPHTLGIQTANIAYCIISPEYVNWASSECTCNTVYCTAQFPKQNSNSSKKYYILGDLGVLKRMGTGTV